MSIPIIHPLAIDSLAVLLIAPLTESLSIDEQAVFGAFLNVLGDLLALNSAYLSLIQPETLDNNDSDNEKTQDQDKDEYELIQKSISKIQEELEKLKQGHCKI